MLQSADPTEREKGFHVHLEDADIAALMQTLLTSDRRIQQLQLSVGSVWIKRQGTEKAPRWVKLQSFLASLLPYKFLKPSPILKPNEMMAREKRRMIEFAQAGFAVPEIIYASETAIVLSDVGPTVQRTLKMFKGQESDAHDPLLVDAAAAIGNLHAAGLCHGRPHVRDFFIRDGQIGFMDFEEEPQSVMPLATAQARDIWLLFLPLTTLAMDAEKTLPAAYNAWASRAPAAAIAELRRLVHVLGRFLPLARLIGRVQMGSDLRRFILATDFLTNAVKTEAAGKKPGEAGKDD
ncbi:serine/threonine protein phosphatase [Agrobacterium larrymoorei]|uniref:Serine/threonine protein phosphatase n=1 Tax=Agrobacterium larrymoorei TaxID=160699 RepID=A0AAF0KJT1_9HYPH|nr:serine/threonine protein phosphatase [Agrobacterium larrymoorei]WHA43079.1 serine/threonine protein phosphatase [Agrobacterium larrymoorei]